ncbi:30S ribosomal protein S11 [Candidatus Roizmanbacteria bacterium CG22_combo_CG10-13_8_21_14_all_38_20]|uniref:Small ribosomal subunit protein uS11 n=1 Tax=Candidatus Roizmanbacteria bacterium CG22_combo_CG10-13_8_21_14_all_38_20 TaxID=1974862 RepID=A0A2H0BX01_9BACT|nr:30S ribosomal protein S11 [Candidatus Microgenomates bacterium]PIP62124.1 MAG: 30S ribosomal protein S11 [Candidatus Roizmanbacteria bacterium CG22_combo_CG10-13_8_21_14_all_38_20]PJC31850.1 MAG: 30S ribosomal protein S11 [Candidatus Roizmanbacteria bacterium CG_4_9_14_0_2_um_filter_38_17]
MAKTKETKKITKKEMKLSKARSSKAGADKKILKGRIYVQATFNNTLVTVTDAQGNTLYWGTSGSVGFKGARKATPFAATTAIDEVIKKSREVGMEEVEVFIKGPGAGRNAVLRSLQTVGMTIKSISDVTPIPHNGVRPPKRRRV